MPSFPRQKKMQKIVNSIIGKPENSVKVRRSVHEIDLWRRLNYDLTRMIR